MIAICNGSEVVFLLSNAADISNWPLVVDGDKTFRNGVDFDKVVISGVDLPSDTNNNDCEYVEGVVRLKDGPTIEEQVRVAGLKLAIEQIESSHQITARQLRELALIVRQIIQAVAPGQPPVYGLEMANTLNEQIIALREQIP